MDGGAAAIRLAASLLVDACGEADGGGDPRVGEGGGGPGHRNVQHRLTRLFRISGLHTENGTNVVRAAAEAFLRRCRYSPLLLSPPPRPPLSSSPPLLSPPPLPLSLSSPPLSSFPLSSFPLSSFPLSLSSLGGAVGSGGGGAMVGAGLGGGASVGTAVGSAVGRTGTAVGSGSVVGEGRAVAVDAGTTVAVGSGVADAGATVAVAVGCVVGVAVAVTVGEGAAGGDESSAIVTCAARTPALDVRPATSA